MVRQGMLVRLATMIDAIDPPAPVGRPRVWPTLAMLRALWHVARDDRAWRRLPPGSPPHQTVWSRLMGWQRGGRAGPGALRPGRLPPARGPLAGNAGRRPRSSTPRA